ncbi:MAG: serine/threonine protein phosphatase [Halochromatium sp.]|nr:serine/threonine protein phosphatase [Halochromatium sp.]
MLADKILPQATPRNLGRALRPMPGESLSGDQHGCWCGTSRLRLAVADGLGHGVDAHRAASAAIHYLSLAERQPLPQLFSGCDQALLGTRGVALGVVDIDAAQGHLLHACVGNIRCLLLQPNRVQRLSGARGIVGAGFSGLRPEVFPFAPGDWLVMFSDGIREDAGFADRLRSADPSDALAEELLARWANDHDDASLVLYRHAEGPITEAA